MTSKTTTTAPGDPLFVYGGPGLVTRFEGWALSVVEIACGEDSEVALKRRVAVFRDADGRLDIAAPLCAVPLRTAEAAWHLIAPDGRIVAGGPRGAGRQPSPSRDELEQLRDEGAHKVLAGSVAVFGLPDGIRRAPFGETVSVTASSGAGFTAARGGRYVWHDPAL
ncbi:hypothetical protein [Streptomyces sp. IBSBF 3010]|uniref:hypothetical protein n=1 Tax=Streptomyces sp. IBSBF 3010 TaxID=2903526 RepID=UPI002FDC1DD3